MNPRMARVEVARTPWAAGRAAERPAALVAFLDAVGDMALLTRDTVRQTLRRPPPWPAVLDQLEQRLSSQRYLAGAAITEADWRLFTTLVRFDAVYYSHFKCNLKRIIDYPNLSNYLRDLYQERGIAATVNMDHIKTHYYASHRHVNPSGIIPRGPLLDFDAPHDRGRFG